MTLIQPEIRYTRIHLALICFVYIMFTGFKAQALIDGTIVKAQDELSLSAVGFIAQTGKSTTGNYCSGALISRRVILTAAHCFESDKDQNIFVGFSNEPAKAIHQKIEGLHFKTNKVRIHPDYFKSRNVFELSRTDIALIYLEQDAPTWTRPLKIIESLSINELPRQILLLASGSEDESYSKRLTNLKTSDFSVMTDLNDYLKTIFLKIQNTDIIYQELLASTKAAEGFFMVKNQNESHISTGDSGSPALITINGTPQIVGVLSRFLDVNSIEVGVLYTNLNNPVINSWIIQQMQQP